MEFNYIPNQKKKKSPKEIISNVKEMPKNMMEKIKKTVEEMKKKGQKLTPELKKLLTKALAGSLVAGMLFMAGCANNGVYQTYSIGVARKLDNADYQAAMVDYDTNTEIANLQIVPEEYYMEKTGLARDDLYKWSTLNNFFTTEGGSLYLSCTVYNTILEDGLVLSTLFKYDIGSTLCDELAKSIKTQVYSDPSSGTCVTPTGLTGKIEFYTNKFSMFAFRYLLDWIINNYQFEVVTECYHDEYASEPQSNNLTNFPAIYEVTPKGNILVYQIDDYGYLRKGRNVLQSDEPISMKNDIPIISHKNLRMSQITGDVNSGELVDESKAKYCHDYTVKTDWLNSAKWLTNQLVEYAFHTSGGYDTRLVGIDIPEVPFGEEHTSD